MSVTFLQSFFADDAPERPNFYTGRILTAKALQQEQDFNTQRALWLGQAMGTGVVSGLFVRAANNAQSVEVGAGMAVDRRGNVLVLDKAKTFPLTDDQDAEIDEKDALFVNCVSGEPISGEGYYLLAISYASKDSGDAAAYSGISPTAKNCYLNTHSELGVQFKLIDLEDYFTPNTTGYNDLSDEEKSLMPYLYRSQLAQQALKVAQSWENLILYPFNNLPHYGLVDTLYTDRVLKDVDVPLTVLYWNDGNIAFVDVWSVRRPAYNPQGMPSLGDVGLGTSQFLPHSSERLTVEQQAMHLQFQHQLAEMIDADDYPLPLAWSFTHLPAAGYLPFPLSNQFVNPASWTAVEADVNNYLENAILASNEGNIALVVANLVSAVETISTASEVSSAEAIPVAAADVRRRFAEAVEVRGEVANVVEVATDFVATPPNTDDPAPAPQWLRTLFDNPNLPAPTPLNPAYIREIFHRANYVAPIPLTRGTPIENVRVHAIEGYDVPYYVFVRDDGKPVVVQDNRGTVVVGVQDSREAGIFTEDLDRVVLERTGSNEIPGTAFDALPADVITPAISDNANDLRFQLLNNMRDSDLERLEAGEVALAIYVFRNVQPGSYTIRAVPAGSSDLLAATATITLGERALVTRLIMLGEAQASESYVTVGLYARSDNSEFGLAIARDDLSSFPLETIVSLQAGNKTFRGAYWRLFEEEPTIPSEAGDAGEAALRAWHESFTPEILAQSELAKKMLTDVESGNSIELVLIFPVPPGDYQLVSNSEMVVVDPGDEIVVVSEGDHETRRVYYVPPRVNVGDRFVIRG